MIPNSAKGTEARVSKKARSAGKARLSVHRVFINNNNNNKELGKAVSTHPGHSLSGQRSLPLLHVIGDAVLGEHGSNGTEDHVVGELLLRALFVACIGNDSKCLSADRATGIVLFATAQW